MSLNISRADTNRSESIIEQSNQDFISDHNVNLQFQESYHKNDQSVTDQACTTTHFKAEDLSLVSGEQNLVINIDDSVNNLISEIVQKSLFYLEKQIVESKPIQANSSLASFNEKEGQDDKENESLNSSHLNLLSTPLFTPSSPCPLSSPSRVLKICQNNTSSSLKVLIKNDENDISNIKNKIIKHSPQNHLKNFMNNSVQQNKQQIKEQSQYSNGFQNINASPFKERDQNSVFQSASPLNSTQCSSEKRQQSQSFSSFNLNLVNSSNQTHCINNQFLNLKKDLQLEQKQVDLIQTINSQTQESHKDPQFSEIESKIQTEQIKNNNRINFNSENISSNQLENMKLNNQILSPLNEQNQDEDLTIKQNMTIQINNEQNVEFQIENQNKQKIEEENLSTYEIDDKVEVQENIPTQTFTNSSHPEKSDTIKEQIKHEDEDTNDQQQSYEDQENIQPINLIEHEDEDEEEQEQEDAPEINIITQQTKEQEITDEQIENKENNFNEEKQNQKETQENLLEEISYEVEEVSETIKHLEGYQNIIRETDNYLDQLVMYMIREKATLTNIQKNILSNNQEVSSEKKSSQETKDSNQISSTSKSQTEQTVQQEEIKQKKQNNDIDDYKYLSKSQREEDTEKKILNTISSKSSQHQANQNSLKTQGHKNNTYLSQSSQNQQTTKYSHVNEMLSLSIESIKFGIVFPGNIFEEQVQITNKTNEMVFIKVVGLCLNPEFDSHGEYVYSIRKAINYDYNEKLMFSITPYSSVKVHVALKVPNINVEKILKGSFAVTVNGYDSYISIPVTSSVEIPKILCTRQLYHASRSSKVIKLAIRRGKKSDCKIPFKNTYGYSLQLEPFWLTDQTNEQHITNIKDGSKCPFHLNLTPQLITVQPKGLFMINLLLRPNQYFKEYNDKRVLSGDKTPLHIKNILIIKVANSSLLLHFPVSLEVY